MTTATAAVLTIDSAEGFAHRCTESIVIERDVDTVYAALHRMGAWPEYLPHVTAIDVQYNDGQYQEFYMTVDSEGMVLKVRSIRNCQDRKIEFFQPEPPPYLVHHGGVWRFEAEGPQRCRVTVTHVWNLRDAEAAEVYPPGGGKSSAQQVCDVLASHSRLALQTWQSVLTGSGK
ncbi:SRPBCC family protein [Streptomyces flavofungini]|uniref:SRPBCC family protein n=1 Tax=Streptomyces flavofungini TaxID=68200 RepID=A0ABS0XGM7_9ACTN|nr:SRPBCC family protein [Streptomyces flavofungini]MBJ3812377.1 SRPBCC family protein [Streptomyces flavofungini]GHC88109.1 hypothetical protein GCM10010349_75130 [Streptomyces flavofungini]